jgi:HAD superfamily hydrolase (TIGR01509 family)
MDGTIVKTERAWDMATRQILEYRGFKNFSKNQIEFLKSLSGIGLLQSAKVIKKEFKLIDSAQRLAKEVQMRAHKLFETGVEFIDGFQNFHAKLQKSLIPTSVASNASDECIVLLNKKMNLNKFFGKNIYGIASVGNIPKPDPAIFLHAAQQLNVDPHECIVFEDSIFGFQAAQAAGMTCIAIENKINQNNLSLAHRAIKSYDEIDFVL